MQATADLQIIPLGNGISVRNEIQLVVALIEEQGFITQRHASGTNIEGNLHELLALVERIHCLLHEQGTIRVLSNIKLETRTDKLPTLAGKIL